VSVGGGKDISLWALVVLAGSITCLVSVVALKDSVVFLVVLKGPDLKSTSAARALGLTVNELLLRELKKFS